MPKQKQNAFDPEVEKLFNKYVKIYKLLFKNIAYITMLVLATVFVVRADYNVQLDYEPLDVGLSDLTMQDSQILVDTVRYKDANYSGVDTKILDGALKFQNEEFMSYKNLAYYSGFVLPYDARVVKSDLENDYTYFQTGAYTIGDIQNYFDVFITREDTNSLLESISSKEFNQQPINKSIYDHFNINCMSSLSTKSAFCQRNIVKFLENFYKYEILEYQQEFENVFYSLLDTKHKDKLCDGIVDVVHYNRQLEDKIKDYAKKCGQDYESKVVLIDRLLDVNSEFEGTSISNTIYSDVDINAYKLVSYQEKIYNMTNNISQMDAIVSYVDYIDNLIPSGQVPDFYKDFTYYYNYSYLKPRISELRTNASGSWRSALSQVSEDLDSLHKGSGLVSRYDGLRNNISNYKLVEHASDVARQHAVAVRQDNSRRRDSLTKTELLEERLDRPSYITVLDVSNQNDKIYNVIMDLEVQIDQGDDEYRTETHRTLARVSYDHDMNEDELLYIRVRGYDEFSKRINQDLSSDTTNVSYNDIVDRLSDWISSDRKEVDYCDMLSSMLGEIDIENGGIELQNCQDDEIVIQRSQYDKSVEFDFDYNPNSNLLEKLQVTDKLEEQRRKERFDGSSVSRSRLNNIVVGIMKQNFKQKEIIKDDGISASIVGQTASTLNDRLNTDLENIERIEDNENQYQIYFELGGYEMKALFDFRTNRMTELTLLYQVSEDEYEQVVLEGTDIMLLDGRDRGTQSDLRNNTDKWVEDNFEDEYNEYQEILEKHEK